MNPLIGGGPAGCSQHHGQPGRERVLLLERNDLWKEAADYGQGRCNVTKQLHDQEVLQERAPDGRFLYSAMTAFPPRKNHDFF